MRIDQKGDEDGTAKSCTFVQSERVCTIGEPIFVTDAATGNVKLIPELLGTTQFVGVCSASFETSTQ